MSGDRKKDFKNVMIMVISTIIIVAFFGYSFIAEEQKVSSILIGCVFMSGILVWTVADIILYRNKYFKPEDKDKIAVKHRRRVEKRRMALGKTIKGNDMYEICSNYVAKNNLSYLWMTLILFGIFGIAMFIAHGELIYSIFCVWFGVSEEGALALLPSVAVFGIYVLVPVLLCLGFYIYLRKNNKAVKILKQAMERCEYDKMRVNDDFMIGPKHHLAQGLLHIGPNFVVLCDKESCLVCEVHDVLAVKKIVELHKKKVRYGMEAEIIYYYVILRTKDAYFKVNCMDEMAVDLIVEEFKQHGIFEEEV